MAPLATTANTHCMNFIEQILQAGFTEQLQKKLLTLKPEKEKWIPKWWLQYPYAKGWYGLSTDQTDAVFKKDGFNAEVLISLNGMVIPYPQKEEDRILIHNNAARYICIKIDGINIYETYSGKIPTEETITQLLQSISKN